MDIVVIINMIIANIIIMFIITTMAVSPFNKDCFFSGPFQKIQESGLSYLSFQSLCRYFVRLARTILRQ